MFQNREKKEKKELGFKQFALDLGIPKELTAHHQFMVELKGAIVDICMHSKKPSLEKFADTLWHTDWYNVRFDSNDIYTGYAAILEEARKHNNFLDTEGINAFIDANTSQIERVHSSVHTAIFTDKAEGKVYIQRIGVGTDPHSRDYELTHNDYRTFSQMSVYSTDKTDLVHLFYNKRLDENKNVEGVSVTEYRTDRNNNNVSSRNIDSNEMPFPNPKNR